MLARSPRPSASVTELRSVQAARWRRSPCRTVARRWPTIFTRIIDGEIPGTFVWRDELCVVFLSINPIARGHALVVPIQEVDHWIDCSPELSARLIAVAR